MICYPIERLLEKVEDKKQEELNNLKFDCKEKTKTLPYDICWLTEDFLSTNNNGMLARINLSHYNYRNLPENVSCDEFSGRITSIYCEYSYKDIKEYQDGRKYYDIEIVHEYKKGFFFVKNNKYKTYIKIPAFEYHGEYETYDFSIYIDNDNRVFDLYKEKCKKDLSDIENYDPDKHSLVEINIQNEYFEDIDTPKPTVEVDYYDLDEWYEYKEKRLNIIKKYDEYKEVIENEVLSEYVKENKKIDNILKKIGVL